MKTDEEHVKTPHHCPYCNSDKIEALAAIEFNGINAFQDITCNACERHWTDVYSLSGYTPSEPDEDEPDTCTNHYACPCGEDWHIEATCGHNDRCPACNKEIEPYYSDCYDDPEPRGKEITAAYNALPHRKP